MKIKTQKIRTKNLYLGLFILLLVFILSLFSFGITGNVVRDDSNLEDYTLLEIKKINGNFVLVESSLARGNIPSLKHKTGEEYGVSLEAGNIPSVKHKTGEEYNIVLDSEEEEGIYLSYINDPEIIHIDGEEEGVLEGGSMAVSDISFFVIVPGNRDSKKFEISKGDEKLIGGEVISVSNFQASLRMKGIVRTFFEIFEDILDSFS
jgi:hypothetical protein